MTVVRVVVFAGLLATAAPIAAIAQSVDPALRFQTIDTPHFSIQFHQGEARQAARLATIAEETWQALKAPLGATPPARTQVILVDQTELANGWATPAPRDTIMVTAVWPDGVEFIGSTADWLRLVFTHEFTHIVHLDRSKGWALAVRRVFGRVPLSFPNLLLPIWEIEGLATFEESAVLHEGREFAGDFRAIVDEAARQHRLEPIDRVNGGLTDWPAGSGAYAYGLGFHAYLAERFGEAAFARLADATAGAIPYLWSRQFTEVFGRSLDSLWHDYEESLMATAAHERGIAATPQDNAVRLTHHGFVVTAPRIAAPACAKCGPQVVYAVRTPHDFPGLYSVPLDGAGPSRKLTDRYLGTTTGVSGQRLFFDQQELHNNVGLYSDLYAFNRVSGDISALTHHARLVDPDVSPDGRRIVAAQNRDGERALVVLDVNSMPAAPAPTVVVSEAETRFNTPRWSPDGRHIVAERHRLGAFPDVVVIDALTGAVRVVAATEHVRWVTPTWRPDGQAIVAAADFNDGPFNVYEINLADLRVRQLTHATGGATWPDVSADGQTLVYAGYTPDGTEVFRMPYRAGEDRTADVAPSGTTVPGPPVPVEDAASPPARTYTPWRTIWPMAWAPTLDSFNGRTRIGGLVTGSDVLGYHAYALAASWIVSQPAGTPQASAATPDLDASYAYTRWTVVPWIGATRSTSFFGVAPSQNGAPLAATVREWQVETGVSLPVVHVRRTQTTRLSFIRAIDEAAVGETTDTRHRSALRAAWSIGTAKTFGYSISPERGVSLGATAEVIRRDLGADADANIVTADVRAYLPGAGSHHVVALRLAGAVSTGTQTVGRVFLLGGGAAAPPVSSFGSEAFSLLRGFAPDSFAGTHISVLNIDYRLPLWRPERGTGTLPAFLHTVHASVFADAGHAWTQSFSTNDIKTSVGAELSANLVLGYWLPLTTTAGAAWGHDGSGRIQDGFRAYVRVGRAF